MSLTQDRPIQRDPDHISVPMDGEFVTMSVERGEYFGIGGVGARAWELLEQPLTVAQLCAQLTQEFEVDTATCEADLLGFAQEMFELGLIKLAGD